MAGPALRVDAKALKQLSSHSPRPLPARLDVLPFAAAYICLAAAGVYLSAVESNYVLLIQALVVVMVLAHVLLLLCEKWFVSVRVAVAFRAAPLEEAHVIKVIPNLNFGDPQICPIQRLEGVDAEEGGSIAFEFRKMRFASSAEDETFRRLKFTTKAPLKYWAKSTGYGSQAKVEDAERVWGLNRFDVPMPSFYDLLQEQMLAPFFVFQVFCVALWCMDEYWYYSIFTLFMLILFECTVVMTRQRNLSELRGLQAPKQHIQVYRAGKWERLLGDLLVPGDVISVSRSPGQGEGHRVVPADCLLLQGTCICEEAVLTGESTPQWKAAISNIGTGDDSSSGPAEIDPGHLLSVKRDKQHILFAGTKVLQNSPPKGSQRLKTPDGGCLAVVLRTGFDTSEGQLMRTILYSTDRMTANSAETGFFICFLLVFAVVAAGYVLYHGLQDPDRSRYKLFLNCTMIITSVIPPELPMELTIAVNQSIMALQKMAVYCTEPFRIPFAGKVDTCCFDKTGTLTSDDLVFQGLLLSSAIGVMAAEGGRLPLTTDMSDTPQEVLRVMAACQSLVTVENQLVGDPLERTAFAATGWAHAGDTVASGKSMPAQQRETVRILRRFQFSSALKRMSAIVRVEAEGGACVSHWVVAKGAPEALQPLMAAGQCGPSYVAAYKQFASQGGRVITLSFRRLGGEMSTSDLRELSREAAESDLKLGALAVFNCPIKRQSEPSLAMLKRSNHRLVMITGDSALTACHVAGRVHIVDRPVLILSRREGHGALYTEGSKGAKCLDDTEFEWMSPDETTREPFSRSACDIGSLGEDFDLCVAGDGLVHASLAGCLDALVPLTQVFARTSPDQKELVISVLKKLGHTTLMCGDGTNDVGSLKAAHIGVALLSAPIKPRRRNRGEAGSRRTAKGAEAAERTGGKSRKAIRTKETQEDRMQSLMESLQADQDSAMVKPGDASMAAPFTAREPSVAPVCDIIRQGRSTLVTTLQMFKILGLMCLSTAYSLSILYLEGIKLGDFQATAAGLLSAALFFMLSASEPRRQLSSMRPHPHIFCAYVFFSLIGQFVVHISFILLVYKAALAETPENERQKPDSDFSPNIVNSATFLCSFAIQTTTFAVNYVGHPFNGSIFKHKKLLYTILGASGFFLAAASEILFEIVNDSVELVSLPIWLRVQLLAGAAADFVLTLVIETVARRAFPAPLPPTKVEQARAVAGARQKAT